MKRKKPLPEFPTEMQAIEWLRNIIPEYQDFLSKYPTEIERQYWARDWCEFALCLEKLLEDLTPEK